MNHEQLIPLQLIGSGGSVSANSRAMFRARSRKEYFAKLGIVAEDADKFSLWLEPLMKIQAQKRKLSVL